MSFIFRGRMIPSEFERLVNRDKADGKTPFFVNATAGTTVTGSYDPINDIADVAEKHGMWLHVDVSSPDPEMGNKAGPRFRELARESGGGINET